MHENYHKNSSKWKSGLQNAIKNKLQTTYTTNTRSKGEISRVGVGQGAVDAAKVEI